MTILSDPGMLATATARLQGLQPEATKLWGKMSVAGMVCHLNDAYTGILSVRADGNRAAAKTPWAGRALLRPLALHMPMKWPRGVPTPPAVDQLKGGTPPVGFGADRDRVLVSMQRFAVTDMDGTVHPIFGQLTQWEWMRWGWLHVDHHLRQFSA